MKKARMIEVLKSFRDDLDKKKQLAYKETQQERPASISDLEDIAGAAGKEEAYADAVEILEIIIRMVQNNEI